MIRTCFFFLLFLLIAACVPADYNAPSYDPYLDRAMGQQAVARSNAAIEATTAAQNRLMAEATLQSAREKDETDFKITQISAEIQGTQSAISAQQTQAAMTQIAAVATQQAQSTAVAWQLYQTPMAATQTALDRQVRIDEAREQRAKVSIWVIPLAIGMAIIWLAWKAGNYIDLKAEILDRDNSVRESRQGTIIRVWDPDLDDYLWTPLMDAALSRRLSSRSDFPLVEAVEFSPSRITATSDSGNGDKQLVTQLIKDAIGKVGDGSNVIPGWRDLKGWNSTKWSKAVKQLAQAGVVKTVEREGTYLRRFESLADLRYALETGQFSPTPQG